MLKRKLKSDLDEKRLESAQLAQQVSALQQELEWMVGERNKLHRMVSEARVAFQALHSTLFPDQHYEINVDWGEK